MTILGVVVALTASVALLWAPAAALQRHATGAADDPAANGSGGLEAATDSADQPAGGRAGASRVAMPTGDLPGWRQTFADDFKRNSLGRNWVAYRGQPQGDPGGWFEPSHVSVRDGVLTLGAWPDQDRRGLYVSGGVSNKPANSQVYGRYEVRFRADQGTGISYAVLLWPTKNETSAEIDIAEDNGRARDKTYATMHSTDGTAHIERELPGDFTDWHTAGVRWSPGLLEFTMDGKVWSRIKNPGVSTVPMSLALQNQAWHCGDSWQACPGATTPKRVDLQVDWAVAYERAR